MKGRPGCPVVGFRTANRTHVVTAAGESNATPGVTEVERSALRVGTRLEHRHYTEDDGHKGIALQIRVLVLRRGYEWMVERFWEERAELFRSHDGFKRQSYAVIEMGAAEAVTNSPGFSLPAGISKTTPQ